MRELLGAEVVAADAMQVYEGLPVLTNQPDRDVRERVRYHLVGRRAAAASRSRYTSTP